MQVVTWGVENSLFLKIYLALAVVAALAVYWILSEPTGARAEGAALAGTLTPTQIGLLAGGRELAVTVALTELRLGSVLDESGNRPVPVATGSPAPPSLDKSATTLTALHRAVLSALAAAQRRHETVTPAVLVADPAVSAALDKKDGRLRGDGLLPGTGDERRRLVVVGGLAALLAVGLARIVGVAVAGQPTGLLLFVVAICGAGSAWATVRLRNCRRTVAARSALILLRRTHAHLSPYLEPSWRTYGDDAVLLATAIFGGAVLFTAEPDFARALSLSAVEAVGDEPSWIGARRAGHGGYDGGDASGCGGCGGGDAGGCGSGCGGGCGGGCAGGGGGGSCGGGGCGGGGGGCGGGGS